MATRKSKSTELEQLLGTADPSEQAQAVQRLQNTLRIRDVNFLLSFNPVANEVRITVGGENISFELLFHILDLARTDLIKMEVKQRMEQEQQNQEEPGEVKTT